METFRVRVADARGRRTVVERSAVQIDFVLRDLHQEGYFVLEVLGPEALAGAGTRPLKPKLLFELTQTLANLTGNGLTLSQALGMARDVFPVGALKSLLTDLATRVEKGQSLHDALSHWRRGLPPLYLGLIRIGERTGELSGVLARLDEYLQARKVISDKTGNALTYPLLVMAVAAVGLILLLTTIFPTLTSIVASVSAGAAAAYARNLEAFQQGATWFGGLLLAAAFALTGVLWRSRSDAGLRLRIDGVVLRLPLAGPYVQTNFGLNASFALETLLSAGYSVEDALVEVQGVVPNHVLKLRLSRVRERVMRGEPLSAAMAAEGGFPATFLSWVAVGEGANDLVKAFGQLRRHYQQELEKVTARWLAVVEPGLIVVVGAVLLGLILLFVTPVFSMLGNIL